MQEHARGKTVHQIRAMIDETYTNEGHSTGAKPTNTPLPPKR